VELLSFVYEYFDYLRFKRTYAGGSFGHRLSYKFSAYLRYIAEDYVMILFESGLMARALEVVEQTHSRALADWMGRTHHNNRIYHHQRSTGSLNACRPANLSSTGFINSFFTSCRTLSSPL